ncbi:unnamed protein product, partial [Ceratitis capitata]
MRTHLMRLNWLVGIGLSDSPKMKPGSKKRKHSNDWIVINPVTASDAPINSLISPPYHGEHIPPSPIGGVSGATTSIYTCPFPYYYIDCILS